MAKQHYDNGKQCRRIGAGIAAWIKETSPEHEYYYGEVSNSTPHYVHGSKKQMHEHSTSLAKLNSGPITCDGNCIKIKIDPNVQDWITGARRFNGYDFTGAVLQILAASDEIMECMRINRQVTYDIETNGGMSDRGTWDYGHLSTRYTTARLREIGASRFLTTVAQRHVRHQIHLREKLENEEKLAMIEKERAATKEAEAQQAAAIKREKKKAKTKMRREAHKLRGNVLDKYADGCEHCKSKQRLTWDHITPIELGGTNTKKNIQVLCQSCNSSKGAGASNTSKGTRQ